MKFTFVINQAGVVRCGLLGRVDVIALCVLDYLRGWFFCKEARRVVVDGREFVWLRYEHAVEELPLLFNPQATVETRKNQLSRLVRGLREAGLVESVKVGRDLYLRPSDLAAALASSRERTATKSAPTITPSHDDTVTSARGDTATPTRDDAPSTIIDETTINQTTIKEPNPHSPPKGDCLNGKSSASTLTQEEEIYGAYPKKAGKPVALRAIRRTLGKHPFAFLLERTRLFAKTYNGDAQFIPHPSTWFGQERFNDDPATWCRPISPPRPGRSGGYVPPRQYGSSNYNQPVENF
jgi:hypothetical protein